MQYWKVAGLQTLEHTRPQWATQEYGTSQRLGPPLVPWPDSAAPRWDGSWKHCHKYSTPSGSTLSADSYATGCPDAFPNPYCGHAGSTPILGKPHAQCAGPESEASAMPRKPPR
eukprot:6848672-Pyramimonas_sp.AAC.1